MQILILLMSLLFVLDACSRAPGRTVHAVTPDTDLATLPTHDAIWELAPGTYRRFPPLAGLRQVEIAPAAGDGEVVLWRVGLRLTGCHEVMIRGLHFRQAPDTALGIEGSERVTIRDCTFTASGLVNGTVTLWLGRGTRNCTVEGCTFDTAGITAPRHQTAAHVHDIAIMTDQIDCTGHRFAGNRIVNYGYGMQLGTSGTCREAGRHLVEDNEIVAPLADGIHVKAARCIVRHNRVTGGRRYGLSARAGFGTRFEENTVTDCRIGIRILGEDHEVIANRIVRARRAAILLRAAKANGDGAAAENTRVAGNVLVDCGGADPLDPYPQAAAGIVLGNDLEQRLGSNVIDGEGEHLLRITGDRE
jgi:hypothetical protein